MQKKHVIWILSLLVSLAGFLVIQHIFTIDPDRISGNGNLGILVMIAFAPFFITSFFMTVRRVGESGHIKNKKKWMVALLLVLSGIVIFFEMDYINDLVKALGGGPGVLESRIYRFGWFNQYTNGIYFNIYTFTLFHILAFLVGIVSIYRNKKRQF